MTRNMVKRTGPWGMPICDVLHCVVTLQLENPQAHFNLALADLAQGNIEQTRARWATLQGIDPHLADELCQEIERLR